MNRKTQLLLFAACLLSGLTLCGCGGAGQTEDLSQTAVTVQTAEGQAATGNFGADLLTAFRETENPVLSPVSAQLALGMLRSGAAGETKAQLDELLGGTDPAGWLETLQAREDSPVVESACAIWFAPGMTVNGDWQESVSQTYGADCQTADLTTEETVTAINSWVSEQTHGCIPVLLDRPLKPTDMAVLLNALYFKGDWEIPFDSEQTREETFHGVSGETEAPFMHLWGEMLGCFSGEGFTGVSLPYRGAGDWQLLCLLPDEGTQPESLGSVDFAALTEGMAFRPVNLSLPKFALEGTYSLTEPLKAMGLTELFTENADFSPMGTAPEGTVRVSEILQKTYFRVDEMGTEAAAVTEVAMDEAAALETGEPLTLTFDRPFLCCLWSGALNQPLFLAAVEALTPETP